ncbi:hypothetical protein GCM10009430_43780 [Aquimarina litoralis]|uniref:4'-phosphopantetheinyl transferase n=1 Tax=Aquimarina litoralis TaxID=584605 RepID=A0ABN1J812_9FLAO
MNLQCTNVLEHFMYIHECLQIEIKENESYLLHYSFDKQFDKSQWTYYLDFLPVSFQKEVLRYRRWQDRYNCLLGKLMVYAGFYLFNAHKIEFKNFLKDSYGKPFIKNSNLNFNISHSGNTVVCIFSHQDIGIDIEEIQHIEYTLFENVFSDQEMQKIEQYGVSKFYEYWTKKEAIIKAIGKGMSIPLLDIKLEDNYSIYNGNRWYTKSEKMGNVYCSIASQYQQNNVNLIELIF